MKTQLTQKQAEEISSILRKQGCKADERLRDKCNWEGMTRTAVIMEWGDPRKWSPLKLKD